MLNVAIGGFDGMHKAHQELLKRANFLLIIEKGSTLTPGKERLKHTNLPYKILKLEEIKDLLPIEFIEYLKSLNTKKVIVGEDFRFGKNRKGDINLLKKYFDVEVIKEVKIDGIGVHSRIIRDFIKKGDIKKANKFLGYNYTIKGKQIRGQGLGSKELLPTINISTLYSYTLPKEAVYITKTSSHPSLTFIGKRSTDGNFSIETHILTPFKEQEIYEIEFLDILRENKKFDNISDLKKTILEDINRAKKYFKENYGTN